MEKNRHILALGFSMLLAHGLEGATYYVATNGDNTASGTSLAAPFQTIQRAAAKMIAGDTCFIRAGTYRETLTVAASGRADAPITFAPYQNEQVVINGTDVVTEWTAHSKAIHQAPMNWDLGMGNNQIFVDGQMMDQACYPNRKATSTLFSPVLTQVTVTTDTIASPDFNQPDGYWAGCYAVGRVSYGWTWQWARIRDSSSGGTLQVTSGSRPKIIPRFGDMAWFTGAGQVYLFGKLAVLDSPGEWHLENKTLYLWTLKGDDPGRHLIEAKRRAWALDFNYQDYIVVRGLQLFAGAVRMNGNNCRLENCEATYLSHFILFPWSGYDAAGGAFDGFQGIVVPGNDNAITGCRISRTAGTAIGLAGSGNLVLRCLITDVDYSGAYGVPIDLSGRRNRVWFNTIHDAGRDIIHAGGTSQDIRFNDLSAPGLLCKDLGVIYSYGTAQGEEEVTRISYNWVHDNSKAGDEGGPGIYLDNYSRNFQVDHNVIWNCVKQAGIQLNRPMVGVRVYNNTLFDCDEVGTHTYNCWPDNNPYPAFWTSDCYQYDSVNNLYLGDTPSSQLRDYAVRDFRLLASSPAIDAGQGIPGFTDGYLGAGPDKGAYESGGVRWTAGIDGVASDGPLVTNSSVVSDIRGTSVHLGGEVQSTYFQPTTITVFWGSSDGGTNPAAWAHTRTFDLSADGPFDFALDGLKPDTIYYYRCQAVNATSLTWAGTSNSFRTQPRPPDRRS